MLLLEAKSSENFAVHKNQIAVLPEDFINKPPRFFLKKRLYRNSQKMPSIFVGVRAETSKTQ